MCSNLNIPSRLSLFLQALRDGKMQDAKSQLVTWMAPECDIRMCHPFGDLKGPQAFTDTVLEPLACAWPDLERRDLIIMAGTDETGQHWVGVCGHYFGTFAAPFLDIPPTGHAAHMRFHEFYRFDDEKCVEIQAIWDLPEVMMQAGVWPMAPSLGREILVPGPMSQDGLCRPPAPAHESQKSRALIVDMLTHMIRHPSQGGPEVMEMSRFWHPLMNWYGPAGIGTARGIAGFRHFHQIPFLAAMPDRGAWPEEVKHHFFADGSYCAVTGWPNMAQTLTGDGWLGIAPTGQKVTLRSLDFWRVENGLIRENWVLVDLLDVFAQLGVDVLARMGQMRNPLHMLQEAG